MPLRVSWSYLVALRLYGRVWVVLMLSTVRWHRKSAPACNEMQDSARKRWRSELGRVHGGWRSWKLKTLNHAE